MNRSTLGLVAQEKMLDALLHEEASLINDECTLRLSQAPREQAQAIHAAREHAMRRLLAWHAYLVACARSRFSGLAQQNLEKPKGACFPYVRKRILASLETSEHGQASTGDLLSDLINTMLVAAVLGWVTGQALSEMLEEKAALLSHIREEPKPKLPKPR